MIIGHSRKIEVRELLRHRLGPLPWALATPESFPKKTNKENFASNLQKEVQLAEQVPQHSATVINGMSLYRRVTLAPTRAHFRKLHLSYCQEFLEEAQRATD